MALNGLSWTGTATFSGTWGANSFGFAILVGLAQEEFQTETPSLLRWHYATFSAYNGSTVTVTTPQGAVTGVSVGTTFDFEIRLVGHYRTEVYVDGNLVNGGACGGLQYASADALPPDEALVLALQIQPPTSATSLSLDFTQGALTGWESDADLDLTTWVSSGSVIWLGRTSTTYTGIKGSGSVHSRIAAVRPPCRAQAVRAPHGATYLVVHDSNGDCGDANLFDLDPDNWTDLVRQFDVFEEYGDATPVSLGGVPFLNDSADIPEASAFEELQAGWWRWEFWLAWSSSPFLDAADFAAWSIAGHLSLSAGRHSINRRGLCQPLMLATGQAYGAVRSAPRVTSSGSIIVSRDSASHGSHWPEATIGSLTFNTTGEIMPYAAQRPDGVLEVGWFHNGKQTIYTSADFGTTWVVERDSTLAGSDNCAMSHAVAPDGRQCAAIYDFTNDAVKVSTRMDFQRAWGAWVEVAEVTTPCWPLVYPLADGRWQVAWYLNRAWTRYRAVDPAGTWSAV